MDLVVEIWLHLDIRKCVIHLKKYIFWKETEKECASVFKMLVLSFQASIRTVHGKFMMFTASGWGGWRGWDCHDLGVLDSHLRVNETKPVGEVRDQSYFLLLPLMYHCEHFCLIPVIEWDFEFRPVTLC